MWSRAELKERGINAFKSNYWKSVLVSLVLMILVSGSGSSSNVRNLANGSEDLIDSNGIYYDEYDDYGFYDDDGFYYDDYDDDALYYDDGTYAGSRDSNTDSSFSGPGLLALGIFGALGAGIVLSLIAAAIVINVFICSPIEIGGCRFFIENAYGRPGAGLLFYAFQSGYYTKIVLTLFLKKLFIVLWSLLLFFPGVVKAYEYRMIPYLLADNPEFSRQEAFRISKEMMDGEKMNAFILDLSFLGWNILSALTFGLAGIFYVNPYENATNAELYLKLKQNYLGQNSGYTGNY